MYKNHTIGVVIPAYNEEDFVAGVIDTMPDFVDKMYLVNDASTDRTLEIALQKATENNRVVIINRKQRGGVGAAILSGHKRALQEHMEVLAVLAGDGQMDPGILLDFLDPVVDGKADYAKGDRLSRREHRREMPAWRAFGNFMLTSLTRISSGYYGISDPQNGYTAISAAVLARLNLDKIEKGFAFENDMLVNLNCIGAKVVDIPHPAVYRGQNSKIRYSHFILQTGWFLLRRFFWRIRMKYFCSQAERTRREGAE